MMYLVFVSQIRNFVVRQETRSAETSCNVAAHSHLACSTSAYPRQSGTLADHSRHGRDEWWGTTLIRRNNCGDEFISRFILRTRTAVYIACSNPFLQFYNTAPSTRPSERSTSEQQQQ